MIIRPGYYRLRGVGTGWSRYAIHFRRWRVAPLTKSGTKHKPTKLMLRAAPAAERRSSHRNLRLIIPATAGIFLFRRKRARPYRPSGGREIDGPSMTQKVSKTLSYW